jgi:hypothetical protein
LGVAALGAVALALLLGLLAALASVVLALL